MKLFYLELIDEDVMWDYTDSFVIRAPDEKRAREIANRASADEGDVWENSSKATCNVLKQDGVETIIINSFNAG